jgi:hypothetical protein
MLAARNPNKRRGPTLVPRSPWLNAGIPRENTADPDFMPSGWSPKLTSCRFGDVFVGMPEVEAKGVTVKVGINGVVRTSVDPPFSRLISA